MKTLTWREVVTGAAGLLAAALVVSCNPDEPAEDADTPAAEESAAAGDDYPLTTCVISGEELGSMGTPVVVEHDGTTVKLCCKDCLPKFNEDPDRHVEKVKQAKESGA